MVLRFVRASTTSMGKDRFVICRARPQRVRTRSADVMFAAMLSSMPCVLRAVMAEDPGFAPHVTARSPNEPEGSLQKSRAVSSKSSRISLIVSERSMNDDLYDVSESGGDVIVLSRQPPSANFDVQIAFEVLRASHGACVVNASSPGTTNSTKRSCTYNNAVSMLV